MYRHYMISSSKKINAIYIYERFCFIILVNNEKTLFVNILFINFNQVNFISYIL